MLIHEITPVRALAVLYFGGRACDGKGFGFDIFPTDPNYGDGRFQFIEDDEEDEDWEEEE